MAQRETSKAIEEEAVRWVTRAEAGRLSSDEERELQEWLAGDVRRAGAFARASAFSVHLDRAVALRPGYRPSERAPALDRRSLLRWSAGAALAASAVLGVGYVVRNETDRHRTRRGEVRVLTLADGSVVTLNTATEVAVRFSEGVRLVLLIAGEALFDVAHDVNRPFVVEAGATFIRAVGTSFTVRRLARSPVAVTVREGAVDIFSNAIRGAPAARLRANERAIAASGSAEVAATPLGLHEIERELAWRDGRIAFEGQTLREAALEFARYSDVRIVIADPSVAEETVTGLFVSTDPVGFARTVGLSFDLDVQVREGEVTLDR